MVAHLGIGGHTSGLFQSMNAERYDRLVKDACLGAVEILSATVGVSKTTEPTS